MIRTYFLGEMTRIISKVIAKGLPRAEEKSEDWIHP